MFEELKNGAEPSRGWFRKCQDEQIPYIIVTKYKKYATVGWDYITFSDFNALLIRKNQEIFRKEVLHIYGNYADPDRSRHSIDDKAVHFFEIDNEEANDLASDLYEVVLRALKNI